jgi:hypothetical protein
MVVERKCCDEIVAAGIAVEGLVHDGEVSRRDAQIWREQHEQRNSESFARAFSSIEKMNSDMNARLTSIEDKLSNRLPLWATIMFSTGASIIGVLVTIVIMLTNHFI